MQSIHFFVFSAAKAQALHLRQHFLQKIFLAPSSYSPTGLLGQKADVEDVKPVALSPESQNVGIMTQRKKISFII